MSRHRIGSSFISAVRLLVGRAAELGRDRQRSALRRLIEETRRRWAIDSRLRFPAKPRIRVDKDGTWIEAWILAGDLAPIDTRVLAAARHGLPLWPGEVYRLLHEDCLTYEAIADRLGLPVDEVRELVGDALSRLEAALGRD